jgi:hypothetical protein
MLYDRCRPYYTILVRSEPAERRAGYELLIKGLERFSEELEKTSDTGMLTNKTHPSSSSCRYLSYADAQHKLLKAIPTNIDTS